ncbi:MAG TPA: nucleoside deaminase [Polyangiaceae bacterium]
MTTPVTEISWKRPNWIAEELDLDGRYANDAARMALVIDLASRNVAHGGGPFGAAVFDAMTGSVVAVGANWVLAQRSSLLHAEITALAFAQARVGSHTLAVGRYDLVASSEPCAQCLGATAWSGVGRIVCGASASDAEAIGFDEGPRPKDWVFELEKRGIAVTLGVLAARATAVLNDYAANGGVIYNGNARLDEGRMR